MSGIHTLTRNSGRETNSNRSNAPRGRQVEHGAGILGAGNAALSGLLSNRDSGHPLDAATLHEMESAFGTSFGHVRVHEGPTAQQQAAGIQARAFTHGSDIYLGGGVQANDRGLMAHELAHVQQQDAAIGARGSVMDRPGDVHETAANRAADAVLTGRSASGVVGGAPPSVQRIPLSGAPVVQKSPVEISLEAFLQREWDVQSKSQQPLKMSKSIREAVDTAFSLTPFGSMAVASALAIDPGTPDALMNKLRGKLPTSVPQYVLDLIDGLPRTDAKAAKQDKSPGAVKAPDFGKDLPPARTPASPADLAPKQKTDQEKSDEQADKYKEALGKAVEGFLATDAGKQLSDKVKEFALSKDGIPFTAIVIGGIVTFVAANDSKVPSVPGIPLGDGIELKFEYNGKLSDLPPLIQKMAGRQPLDPQGGTETKVSVSLTVTDDEIVNFAKAVGRFFVVVGSAIGAGAVKVGTVIGKTVKTIWPELAAVAGGAGIGALIGWLVGGPIGAGIGAAIGAGVGLIGALIKRIFF